MFADVSGFTALSEAMAKYGPEGAEYLAKHLNSYFGQMVKAIASEGGDIFKFAGDAMIVLWPDLDTMEARARRAAQCALAIQEALHAAELSEGVTLSVKIGIGMGRVSVLHLGGVLKRMEYVAVGDPLVQAFNAEGHAEAGGATIVSPQLWKVINPYVNALEVFPDGYARLTKHGKGISPEASEGLGAIKKREKRVNKTRMMKDLGLDSLDSIPGLEKLLKCYLPGAILPWVSPESADLESWGGDLRNATVMFVNLGLKEHDLLAAAHYDDAMVRAHNVLMAVQSAVYQYEGAVNKFLMDDKGSTLIAVWGLPPLSHEDDPTRGVLCGLAICERLWELGLVASCGITTGVVFCGVVGSTTRKEYSVLGDTVNLSARLMQRATKQGGGVICDRQVRLLAQQGLEFKDEGEISVKGKSHKINIFKPYPADVAGKMPPTNAPGSEPKLYRQAYESQVFNYHSYATLRPHHVNPIPALSSPGDQQAGEIVAAATAAGAAGTANPNRASTRLPGRRTTKMLNALGGSGGSGSAVDIVGGLSEGPLDASIIPREPPSALSQSRTTVLLDTEPATYSATTVPTVEQLKLMVPTGMAEDAWLLSDLEYTSLQSESLDVELGSDGTLTMAQARDKAVQAAKDAGYLPKSADANELRLQVDGSSAILPANALPMLWMGVFISEITAVDPLKFNGVLTVLLCKARDEPVLMPRHFAARQGMVEGKMNLFATKQGGTVLLEGAMGTGKTWLLRQFVGQVMPGKTSMFCANGSPFTRTNPFAVWGALLRQFVDLYGATNSISSRTAVTQQLLQKFAPDRRLLPLASLLNACLTVNLPDSAALDKLTMSQKQSATSALLMVLLRAMVGSAALPVTLVIDDAMYMHEASWDLALHLAAVCSAPVGTADSLPLLLVIAARTPRPYCDVIMPSVPSSYAALLQAPFVKCVRISRLPRRHARAMVQSSLLWHGSIDDSLHTLVEGRAQGNPLMIQEVMLSLVNKQRLMVVADPQDRMVVQRMQLGTALVPFYGLDLGGGAKVSARGAGASGGRRASFQGHLLQSKTGVKLGLGGKLQLVAGVATPVPFCHKVTSNLGMQVDRLPTLEQMVLKVGSVIADAKQKEEIAKLGESGSSGTSIAAKRIFDHRFKFSVLFEVFPLKEVKDLLGELCASLEERGFIIRTLAATAGKGGASSNTVSLRNINLGDTAPATAAAGSDAASKEPIFEFTHSFVSDTVRLRVLAEQRKQLEKGIQDCFKRQAELLRRIYVTKVMETKGASGQPDKSGTLNVRKNVPGSSKKQGVFSFGTVKSEWKSRFVSIKSDNLVMFRDQHEEQSGQDPVQSIPLSASTATLLPGSQDLKHEHVFRVDASHYIKKGQLVQESRSFYMAADSKEEADDWVFWMSFMRDKLAASGASLHKGITGNSPGSSDEDAATAAARRLVEYGSESAYAIAAERGAIFPRTRLLVTVEEGADLPPAKQTGHTSPYVTVQMGRTEKRVNPVLLSRNPQWLSTVALAVTPSMAAEGVLRVQVWDKDKYAADSLIGVVEVPLVDVALHAPPARPKLDEWLAGWGEGGAAAEAEGDDEGYDSEEGEEEEEKEAYLEAARAETEAQATVEPQTFALVAPDVLQRATVAQIQANGGNWRLPLNYESIMAAAQTDDVNRGTVALRLRLVAEGDDWGAIETARQTFREGAASATDASDDNTAHHSLAARALFLLGRADLSWLSSMDMSASTGHAQGMGGEGGATGGEAGAVDIPALMDRLQHLNDMLTSMQNTGAATLTKDAIGSLRKGLDQSVAALRQGGGGGGSDDANQRAIADGVGGSSAAGAASFINMVSLLDLDETNREWLASQYSKADSDAISSSRGSLTGQASSPKARSSRQSTAVRNMRRSSAIVISPGDANTHTAIRRLSQHSLNGLAAVSEDEVQVEMDTAWGDDAPPAMDAHELHAQRCLQVPGYLTLGASHLSYVQTWGRYGWGVQALTHGESEDPDEGELAAAAVRGDEGGGYYTDLMEQLTYEDTEDNVQGPFPARDIFEWHEEGYMPDDMMIRCGSEEDGGSMVLLQDIISGLAIRAHLSRLRELTYDAATEHGATDVDIDSWDFNMFSLALEHPVHAIPIASYVFASLRLPKFFAIREDCFVAFLADVCDRMCLYPDSTPYHNYWHVTDVMHTVYIMLTRFKAGALLSPSEILGLVVAALCHDLEHPGLGNSYQVNAQTELALRYNDCSVLESHHAALASVVVRDSALFGGLPDTVARASRKVMLSAILATDMTCHFGLTSDLRGVAERHVKRMQYLTGASRVAKVCTAAELAAHGSEYGIEGTATKPAEGYELAASIPAADREIVYKTLLHAADISNPAKSWALCKLWSDRVVEEFHLQGDREKAESLPVSPNMDRDNTNQAKMSLNFIDFIVAPLLVAMTTLLPPMQEACDSLAANRAQWEGIVHTELDSAATPQADTERRQWKRRQTAFQQVLMPLSKLGGGSGSDASRAMALSGLQTFVAANVVAEEDEGE